MAIFYGGFSNCYVWHSSAAATPDHPWDFFTCLWVSQKPSTHVFSGFANDAYLCFFLIIDDDFWLLLIIYDYLWLFMIICGYFWLFMIMFDYLLLFMIIYCFLWLFMFFWIIYDYFWSLLITYDYLCLFMFLKWFFMIVCDYSWLFVWWFMIVWCWFTIIDPKAWRFSWGKPAVRSFFQAWHRRFLLCRTGSFGRCVTWDWAGANQKIPVDS